MASESCTLQSSLDKVHPTMQGKSEMLKTTTWGQYIVQNINKNLDKLGLVKHCGSYSNELEVPVLSDIMTESGEISAKECLLPLCVENQIGSSSNILTNSEESFDTVNRCNSGYFSRLFGVYKEEFSLLGDKARQESGILDVMFNSGPMKCSFDTSADGHHNLHLQIEEAPIFCTSLGRSHTTLDVIQSEASALLEDLYSSEPIPDWPEEVNNKAPTLLQLLAADAVADINHHRLPVVVIPEEGVGENQAESSLQVWREGVEMCGIHTLNVNHLDLYLDWRLIRSFGPTGRMCLPECCKKWKPSRISVEHRTRFGVA